MWIVVVDHDLKMVAAVFGNLASITAKVKELRDSKRRVDCNPSADTKRQPSDESIRKAYPGYKVVEFITILADGDAVYLIGRVRLKRVFSVSAHEDRCLLEVDGVAVPV